jgi:hypothetical protein
MVKDATTGVPELREIPEAEEGAHKTFSGVGLEEAGGTLERISTARKGISAGRPEVATGTTKFASLEIGKARRRAMIVFESEISNKTLNDRLRKLCFT